jgi:thioredoxin:protein disulfide reductase
MKLLSIAPADAGAAMFYTWMGLSHEVADPKTPAIAWLDDDEAAIAKARTEDKPMVIDFRAEWCEGCRKLDQGTFVDPFVRRESQRFVMLKIDLTDDDDPKVIATRKKYGIDQGLPVVVMLDKRGKEVLRYNEPVGPDRFYAAMKCNVGGADKRIGMR